MKAILTIALLLLVGCNTQTSKQMDQTTNRNKVAEIESATGMKFPADAQILLDEDAGQRTGEVHLTVIHSKSKMNAPTKEVTPITAEKDSDTSLHRVLSDKKIGKLKDMNLYISEWENQRGRWRSTLIETETGFYLELENFKPTK